MSAYSQTGMSVTTTATDNFGSHKVVVGLNKGGSSATPRDDIVITIYRTSTSDSFVDPTKTYSVVITEE